MTQQLCSKRPNANPSRRSALALSAMLAGVVAMPSGLLFQSSPALAQDVAAQFTAAGDKTFDHAAWTDLLKTYVKPSSDGLNRVNYKAFKSGGRTALTAYLAKLEATDVTALSKPEQFAFWSNLYNAKTIDVVLDHYPVASIRDIDISGFFKNGPWDKKVTKVNGTELSLNDIEHGILRGTFKDPRVHYAVNCASVGCPNLLVEAFSGATLENQLDAAAKGYINSPRGVTVSGNSIRASKIFSWFQEDFGDSEQGVLKHAAKYAEPGLASKLKAASDIDGFDYDWSLNDTDK